MAHFECKDDMHIQYFGQNKNSSCVEKRITYLSNTIRNGNRCNVCRQHRLTLIYTRFKLSLCFLSCTMQL